MFFTQFGLLFSNMEWYVLVCFLVGLAFLIIEAVEPGFGFFGISGITLLASSIVLRAVFHKENDIVVMQIFQFLLFDLLIFGVIVLFLYIAGKKGWLKKIKLFQTETAVDENFSDGMKNYGYLVGKEGIAATCLRPSGKAEIDGCVYDVESTGFLIEKGEKIKVTDFVGGVIKVIKQ